jgi:hypothetical protein
MDTAHDTLIQRIVPAPLLGRVFANVYGAVSLAAGLSYLLGGLLLDATNPRVTLIAAGAGGLAVTPIVAWRLRAASVRTEAAAAPDRELAGRCWWRPGYQREETAEFAPIPG